MKLIKIYKEGCAPCKMLDPALVMVHEARPDVTIEHLNIEDNRDAIEKYGVRTVPMLILEKDGTVLHTLNGLQTARNIIGSIDEHDS
jgi:thioredoxin 1